MAMERHGTGKTWQRKDMSNPTARCGAVGDQLEGFSIRSEGAQFFGVVGGAALRAEAVVFSLIQYPAE